MQLVSGLPWLAVILLAVSCGGESRPANVLPKDPAEALRAAQKALNDAGGYRLRFEQSNFVLPQWGGIDSGAIEINKDGTSAKATITRTGERDTTYMITLNGGKTYFQRSTCQETFRIPGGGADVLRPFLFTRTNALATATNPQWQGEAIHAVVDGLGPVDIVLDEKTGRPSQIRGTSNNQPQVWTFEAWGVNPSISAAFGSLQERGPGGIPC